MIKKLLIYALKWIVPNNIWLQIRELTSLRYLQAKYNSYNCEIQTTIIRQNESVYIFGTGPSVKNMNFVDFIGNDIFVCNEFNQHDKFSSISTQNNMTYFMGDNLKSFMQIGVDFKLNDDQIWKTFLKVDFHINIFLF
jgi:hypothetical protein